MTENKRYSYDNKSVSLLRNGEFWLDGNIDTACNHSEICDELNTLNDENRELKSELESAMGEINHCHLIIATLVANEGVNDYFDLLNRCDDEVLKEMGWE